MESTTIQFKYDDKKELYRYLDSISYALYGYSYNELIFLNNNRMDFTPTNVLFSC